MTPNPFSPVKSLLTTSRLLNSKSKLNKSSFSQLSRIVNGSVVLTGWVTTKHSFFGVTLFERLALVNTKKALLEKGMFDNVPLVTCGQDGGVTRVLQARK